MEKEYLNALQTVLDEGVTRKDRTGVGTISVFGMQQRYDLRTGFPAITTKKLAWLSVLSELLWFIEGSGDERRLAEILHGDRDAQNKDGTLKRTIWTANAEADYWTDKALFPGDLGRVYGVQWRNWRKVPTTLWGKFKSFFGCYDTVDQLTDLVNGIKKDPYGRRHILSAWNPGELDQMALPPCHVFAQFYVADGKLSCQLYQRSCDMFLGVPFNIASYAILTHMIAQVCDLEVGEFVHTLGDAHIYLNHVDAVKEQLAREPYDAPKLWINPDIKDITKFTMDDIKLIGYKHHASIVAPMAV